MEDDRLLQVEKLSLRELGQHLFVKVKKQLEDDHLLFVETLLHLNVGQQLFVKVKEQFVDATQKKSKSLKMK